MSAVDFPEIDHEGSNVTASTMLDEHHEVVGWSGFGDDLIDNCEVCWFAAGWTHPADMDGRDHFGHATACDVAEVRKWIEARENGSDDYIRLRGCGRFHSGPCALDADGRCSRWAPENGSNPEATR